MRRRGDCGAASRAAASLRCDQRLSENGCGCFGVVGHGRRQRERHPRGGRSRSERAVLERVVAPHLAPRLGLVMFGNVRAHPREDRLGHRHRIDAFPAVHDAARLVVADGDDLHARRGLAAILRRAPHDEDERRVRRDVEEVAFGLGSGAVRSRTREIATACPPVRPPRVRAHRAPRTRTLGDPVHGTTAAGRHCSFAQRFTMGTRSISDVDGKILWLHGYSMASTATATR